MKFFFLVLFFILHFNISTENSTHFQQYYKDIFEISKEKDEDREYLLSGVKELEADHPLAESVNNNKILLKYWLTNFVDHEAFHQLKSIEGEEELQQEFVAFLKKDTLFNPLMVRFSEKALNPHFVADTVSMDELLNVAVKYFNILGITEEGYYKGKVCAGVNGITSTLPQRKPELEAFCFSAILQNHKGDQFNMHQEFVAAIRELYKQELGVDREARLLRAQGAMFSLMRNNEQLREMLISEYELKKDFLPFVLEASATAEKS
jgi:hypothetical protein